MVGFSRTLLTLLFIFAVASAVSSGVVEEQAETRFLDGLRDRQLFELAQTHCRRRLQRDDLTAKQRAAATSEWMRTLAAHAQAVPPRQRPELWQRLDTVAANFRKDHPQHPRLILIQVQHALALLARGQLARIEHDVGAPGSLPIDQVRTLLRDASDRLFKLENRVDDMVRESYRTRGDEQALNSNELLSLQRNLRFQLAQAQIEHALIYPAESASRVAELTQALQAVEPLTGIELTDTLGWPVRLLRVRAFRLLGKARDARSEIAKLLALAPPATVTLKLRAESAQTWLSESQPDQALQVLKEGREIDGQTSPVLDFVHLKVFLALAAQAAQNNRAAEAKEWQQKAAAAVKTIEALHGAYWLRRAETHLAAAAEGTGEGNVELVARAADDAFRREQWADAAATYDQAATLALKRGQETAAFELFLKAAAAVQRRGDAAALRDRLVTLSTRLPSQQRAPGLHRAAILLAAGQARNEPAALEVYEELLAEHLRLWPRDASSLEVRVWLGRLHRSRKKWDEALAVLTDALPTGGGHGSAGDNGSRGDNNTQAEQLHQLVQTAEPCFVAKIEQVLADRQGDAEANQAVRDSVRQAATFFEELVLSPSGELPRVWSPAHQAAALAATRLQLRYTEDFAAAESILRRLLASAENGFDQKEEAVLLHVVALAGLGRTDEAQAVLGKLSGGRASDLLTAVHSLGKLCEQSTPSRRRKLREVQLTAISLAEATDHGSLSAEEKLQLERARVAALADTGRREAARERLAKLAIW